MISNNNNSHNNKQNNTTSPGRQQNAVAVVFPGQGSQKVGMGKFYYEQFSIAKKLFEEAEDTLKINLKKLCFEGPETALQQTENTQPALTLVSSVAWHCLQQEMNLNCIHYGAGHSVGEYTALMAARVLSFSGAMQAVRKRGLWMKEASPPGMGGMSALLGPNSTEAKTFCKWVEETSTFQPLEVANFNTPAQTVLSGSLKALKWAGENYKQYKFSAPAKLIPLKVSGPFHSSLMKPACHKMQHWLKNIPFKNPDFPIVQNTHAKPCFEPDQIRHNLALQIKSPVEWVQTIHFLKQKNISHFLELGEGKILAGLIKKIIPEAKILHFHSTQDLHYINSLFTA